jgi:chitinase/chitodextrinase
VGLNKWIAGIAVAVLATAGAALLPSASASAATNLVNNPGFESGTSGWTCSTLDHAVTTPVHGGTSALTGTAAGQDFAQCTQVVAVQPSSAYTLTGFVDGGFAFIGDTGTGTTDSSTFSQGTSSYTQLSTSFNTGASTTSVTIFVHGWYGQPTFFADDFTLTGPGGTVTVPSAPAGLSVTGSTSSTVSLSWSAATGATGYNVYRNGTKVGSATGTTFTDSGLAASTTFTYQVTATNSAGESAKSASVSGTTAGSGTSVPAAPTGLRVTGTTSSSVSLSWTASTGATGYNVYRNGTKVGSATTTSFTNTGLAASTTFSYAVTATNTAGESAKSAAVNGTTGASGGNGGGGGLPAHILTGYWQDFTNGAMPLRLSAVPTTYDLVAVAFANATGTPGAVSYTTDSGLSSALGGYTDANFTSDIATLHSRGQKVIISVGGQNGTISVSDSSSASNFASSINSLMNQFGFDGVDIDLENGVNPQFMAQALHSVAASHPGMIITLAPQTIDMQSTGGDYFQLALDIKDVLTVVNTQYYNSGSMLGCDQNQAYSEATENFMTALACIQLQGGLSPSQVGLGLPANANGAGSGAVAPSLVNNALDCLDMGTNCGTFKPPSTWPGLRGAMDWSINWDASNGFAFANTVHPHLSTLK